jgi:hypothetical protein
VANVRRPKVSEDSPTIGLDAAELDRLLTAAEAHGLRSAALVSLLVYNGLRIDEALAGDVTDLTYQRGHRVLRIVREGGMASAEPLAPLVVRVLEDYVAERSAGPLFVNREGTARLSYSTSYALIRRLARRAGIGAADRLSPHSLRHSMPPSCSAPACRSRTCRTPWAMPIPAPPGATTGPGTTSTGTRRTRWLQICAAAPPQRRAPGASQRTRNGGVPRLVPGFLGSRRADRRCRQSGPERVRDHRRRCASGPLRWCHIAHANPSARRLPALTAAAALRSAPG